MRGNRLAGHTLYREGWPCDDAGEPVDSFRARAGVGRAKCSCGELSMSLDSQRQRQQWHRDHKNQIRGDRVLAEIRAAGSVEAWREQQ